VRGQRVEYWRNEICEAVGKSAKHECHTHINFEIKSLWEEAQKEALKERDKYRKTLKEIAPMCGNPDAVDACRLILNKCQEALKDG
jgi:hypothetical protein